MRSQEELESIDFDRPTDGLDSIYAGSHLNVEVRLFALGSLTFLEVTHHSSCESNLNMFSMLGFVVLYFGLLWGDVMKAWMFVNFFQETEILYYLCESRRL